MLGYRSVELLGGALSAFSFRWAARDSALEIYICGNDIAVPSFTVPSFTVPSFISTNALFYQRVGGTPMMVLQISRRGLFRHDASCEKGMMFPGGMLGLFLESAESKRLIRGEAERARHVARVLQLFRCEDL